MKKLIFPLILLLNASLMFSKNSSKEIIIEENEYLVDSTAVVEEENIDDGMLYYNEAYFDADWNMCGKENAVFYRFVNQDSLFRITDFYMSNGMVQATGCFRTLDNEERIGLFRFYYENGQLETEVNYDKNGFPTGERKHYDKNGKLKRIETYNDGSLKGELTTYYPTGSLKRIEVYRDNEMFLGRCFDSKGHEISYFDLCTCVEYPGGKQAIIRDFKKGMDGKYINNNDVLYNDTYMTANVDENGKVVNVKLVGSSDAEFLKSVQKAASKLKRFKPATVDGENVMSKLRFKFN